MTIQHKHHAVYSDLSTAEKRLVSVNGPGGPGTGAETAKGETEQTEKWRGVDAMSKFDNDAEKVFLNLAKEAFPGDKAQQTEYAKRINDSLKNHLAPGRTMEELWQHLQNQNCDIVAIIQGFLNFFSGKENKINIDEFFNVGGFSAELPVDKEYAENRETAMADTKTALENLLNDLRSSHPDLPNLPS